MFKFFYHGTAVAAISSALFLSACADDDLFNRDGDFASDHICFRTGDMSWGNLADKTRAVGNPSDFVLRDRNSSDTLCVKAIVTDGIQTPRATTASRGQMTTKDNLNDFGVFAYTQQNGQKLYINNEQYTKKVVDGTTIYDSQNIYYWPGSQLTFDFYTYSPYNASGLQLPNAESKELTYRVPDEIANQQDLMLAVNEKVPGDNNKAVPLNFQHLLSAVNVVAGAQMPAGTIQKISFTGVVTSGTINMDNIAGGWTLSDAEGNIQTYTATPNLTTTGNADQDLLGDNNYFFFLPQQLVDNSIEIDFLPEGETVVRHLTSPITGAWTMGTTTTYRLSITPEYELKFDTNPIDVQDAHYVTCTTSITAGDLKGKSWRVEAVASDGADVTIQNEEEVSPMFHVTVSGWIKKQTTEHRQLNQLVEQHHIQITKKAIL